MTRMNWLKLKNKHLVFIIFSLGVYFGFAQDLEKWQKKYEGHHELILKESQTYNFTINKNKLHVVQDNYFESIIFSEMGIHNNSELLHYSDLVPLKSHEAFTIINDRGKEKKIAIKQYTDKKAQQRNVFYSDLIERKIVFPNLELGAKKTYSYQSEFLDPFLLHRFSFVSDLPIKKSSFEIIADKGIEIGYKIFNDFENRIVFSKKEHKGKNIYTWEMNEVLPLKYESNNPGYLYIAPHIVFYIQSYMAGKEKVELLGNIDQLYKYYLNFVKDLNKNEDAELKAITEQLVKGMTSDKEKIKAIFYWVKDNIKYVAFENGYEGFIPREASVVNQRRFGDCKDMSSIITDMARYANVPNVNLCWVGTRRIPYSYAEVSTPAVDDHMIASVEIDGEIIFLDATDSETPFGLPSSFIQGKEVLVRDGESYKIVKAPIVEAAKNSVSEKIKAKLTGAKIEGKGQFFMEGLARTNFLLNIGDASNKARFDIIKGLVQKGNNKFNLKDYQEYNISDRDLPYQVDFNFELDNYVVEVSDEMYVNLFLDKPLEKLTIEADRKSMYEFDFLFVQSLEIELEIPENMKVKTLPENASLNNDLVKYKVEYELKDRKIILNFEIETKKILLEKSDFELWNQTIKDLKSLYNEMIMLKTK